MIPRKFFHEKFDEWQSGGYKMIDFTKSDVDLSSMPDYYQDRYAHMTRKVEKNYFLNHLLHHQLAQVEQLNSTYYFKPDLIDTLHIIDANEVNSPLINASI